LLSNNIVKHVCNEEDVYKAKIITETNIYKLYFVTHETKWYCERHHDEDDEVERLPEDVKVGVNYYPTVDFKVEIMMVLSVYIFDLAL